MELNCVRYNLAAGVLLSISLYMRAISLLNALAACWRFNLRLSRYQISLLLTKRDT